MAIGDADLIHPYLIEQVKSARLRGERTITFRAGDIHKALGLVNVYPIVCQALESQKFHEAAGVRIARYIKRPPSGRGANLIIEFRIL